MKWKNVKLILQREVRDQLRDRRTLFMIAILPLLLYPALGIGMVQMSMLFSEQPRTVVILGAKHLPADPPFLDGERIAGNWFTLPQDADKIVVVTDADEQPDPGTRKLLAQAREIQKLLAERERRAGAIAQATGLQPDSPKVLRHSDLTPVNRELGQLFRDSDLQIVILVPEGLAGDLKRIKRGQPGQAVPDAQPAANGRTLRQPRPVRNIADEKSQVAYRRVKAALDSWWEKVFEQRFSIAGLDKNLVSSLNIKSIDIAEKGQISASLWAKLFPALLVIMAVTGAFYPAVDLAAGEKERGTMETLLICPATRTEIVLGKFFTIMLFSMSTAILNLMSMGLTGKYMVSMAGSGTLSKIGNLAPPSLGAIIWVLVLLIPLAALFSALCLSLATFARSSKEGQYYLTPLLMVTMGATIFCLSPAIEISPLYSMLPVIGPTLLLKEMLASTGQSDAIVYAIPVLVASTIYSLLAIWWAIEQFNREDVLFREAERIELGLWLKHLLRDKSFTPSFGQAGACFVGIMLLQFWSWNVLTGAGARSATDLMRLQIIYLLATIATPALLMGVILTSRPRLTFKLKLPRGSMIAAAVVLPFVLHPLSSELQARLAWLFPELPPGAARFFGSMTDPGLSIWLILLTFAVTPAICEEIAFRGFILSGFSSSRRMWLAIALSSLTFGVVHMMPQQVLNASLLGIVLGLLAIRSGSLLPPMILHFLYNAIVVLQSRIDATWLKTPLARWFVTLESTPAGERIRYNWPTLAVGGVVALGVLQWLVRCGKSEPAAGNPPLTADQPVRDASVAAGRSVRAG